MNAIWKCVAVISALLLAGAASKGADYPQRTIRILVGFPPGGPPDVIARELGAKFNAAWGRPVVIENITGAGGNLAVAQVAKSVPDGYTLAMTGSSSLVISPSLYKKLAYDPVRDFAPISATASTRTVLVVSNELQVSDVAGLVSLIRSKPGHYSFGSAGFASPGHLAGELFKASAGLNMQHIPYRGIPPLLPDLMAGRIVLTFSNQLAVMPLVKQGKLRVLAATSKTRSPQSTIPTMAESGFPNFDVTAWIGLVAPRATSQAIIDQLYRETAKVLTQPDMRNRLEQLGVDVIANTPEEFSATIKSEIPNWAKIIKDAGLSGAD